MIISFSLEPQERTFHEILPFCWLIVRWREWGPVTDFCSENRAVSRHLTRSVLLSSDERRTCIKYHTSQVDLEQKLTTTLAEFERRQFQNEPVLKHAAIYQSSRCGPFLWASIKASLHLLLHSYLLTHLITYVISTYFALLKKTQLPLT